MTKADIHFKVKEKDGRMLQFTGNFDTFEEAEAWYLDKGKGQYFISRGIKLMMLPPQDIRDIMRECCVEIYRYNDKSKMNSFYKAMRKAGYSKKQFKMITGL